MREAARLRSFPDGFTFSGAMNTAFQQIGNAVPPLLAEAIATEMMETIRSAAVAVAAARAGTATGVRKTPDARSGHRAGSVTIGRGVQA